MLINLDNFDTNLAKQQFVVTADQVGVRAFAWVSYYNVVSGYSNHQWGIEEDRPKDVD